jgi:hypothetical protein
MRPKRSYLPALALFLLSPIVGELLSGSSPPLEFLNPIGFAFMAGLYGCGAVIIRELAMRWNKGWTSILVMGVAYGIIEEGLMVKSFFDPNWVDIGVLGSYGRFAGVNWVWSTELAIYHAVFSIAIPILLITLLFREDSGRRWVSDRTLKMLFGVLALDVALGPLFLTPYVPEPQNFLLALAMVFALFVLVYALPRHYFLPRDVPVPRPGRFLALGAFFSSTFFLTLWVLSATGVNPLVPIALVLLLSWYCFSTVKRWSGNGAQWQPRHQLALASGALSFLILFTFLHELGGGGMSGMSVVGMAFILFLSWLWRGLPSTEDIEPKSHPWGIPPPDFR